MCDKKFHPFHLYGISSGFCVQKVTKIGLFLAVLVKNYNVDIFL